MSQILIFSPCLLFTLSYSFSHKPTLKFLNSRVLVWFSKHRHAAPSSTLYQRLNGIWPPGGCPWLCLAFMKPQTAEQRSSRLKRLALPGDRSDWRENRCLFASCVHGFPSMGCRLQQGESTLQSQLITSLNPGWVENLYVLSRWVFNTNVKITVLMSLTGQHLTDQRSAMLEKKTWLQFILLYVVITDTVWGIRDVALNWSKWWKRLGKDNVF